MSGETATLEQAMRRALELARRGPVTGVNPQVGCVILSPGGRVLAEGWHRGAGTAHAEVDALGKLPDASGTTAVVTLEPCNHVGKTGPCSEALIEAGVSRVVYGVDDPDPRAKGGAKRLAEAGIQVQGGMLAGEVAEQLRSWLTATTLGRPYIIVKWASSLDGRIAAPDGSSRWITGEPARQHAHQQRATVDAIAVGTGTVLADDPSLTARDGTGALLPWQPVPVVVGEREVPAEARVRAHPKPLIASGSRDLPGLLTRLFGLGLRRVLVEGGPRLVGAFVAAGLADEYHAYLAPCLIGGENLALGDIGVASIGQAMRLQPIAVERLGDDVLIVARPQGRD